MATPRTAPTRRKSNRIWESTQSKEDVGPAEHEWQINLLEYVNQRPNLAIRVVVSFTALMP